MIASCFRVHNFLFHIHTYVQLYFLTVLLTVCFISPIYKHRLRNSCAFSCFRRKRSKPLLSSKADEDSYRDPASLSYNNLAGMAHQQDEYGTYHDPDLLRQPNRSSALCQSLKSVGECAQSTQKLYQSSIQEHTVVDIRSCLTTKIIILLNGTAYFQRTCPLSLLIARCT